MTLLGGTKLAEVAALLLLVALTGCVSQPKSLYYWGDYQPQVYAYFKGDGESPEAQLAKLEFVAQKAQAQGEALPPGFHAHLGLLYLKAGRLDLARQSFQTEETLFPESKPYMDFLLRKFEERKG